MMNERCEQLANTKFVDNICSTGLDKMSDVIDEYYFKFLENKVRWFFEYNYQKQLTDKHGSIIYLIEESQRYFDSKELGRQKWVRDVLYYFEKHRHFGHSILIDTQHNSKIHKGIFKLCETETAAKPRTLSVGGEFKYNEYSDGSKTNSVPIVVLPNKKIFKTYKSMSNKEHIKTKKPVLKILVFVVIMVCLSMTVLNYAKKNIGPGESIASETKISKRIPEQKKIVSGGFQQDSFVQVIQNEKPGKWVRLTYTLSASGKVTIVHPVNHSIILVQEFDLQFKRLGNEMFAYIPGDYGEF